MCSLESVGTAPNKPLCTVQRLKILFHILGPNVTIQKRATDATNWWLCARRLLCCSKMFSTICDLLLTRIRPTIVLKWVCDVQNVNLYPAPIVMAAAQLNGLFPCCKSAYPFASVWLCTPLNSLFWSLPTSSQPQILEFAIRSAPKLDSCGQIRILFEEKINGSGSVWPVWLAERADASFRPLILTPSDSFLSIDSWFRVQSALPATVCAKQRFNYTFIQLEIQRFFFFFFF